MTVDTRTDDNEGMISLQSFVFAIVGRFLVDAEFNFELYAPFIPTCSSSTMAVIDDIPNQVYLETNDYASCRRYAAATATG
jgi:hypothetical protein